MLLVIDSYCRIRLSLNNKSPVNNCFTEEFAAEYEEHYILFIIPDSMLQGVFSFFGFTEINF